jgi:hypothetical protein
MSEFTSEQVMRAANEGADLILEGFDVTDREIDLVNLVVNAISSCLKNPNATLSDVASENYEADLEEIHGWWDW